jgi:hypothetical protein
VTSSTNAGPLGGGRQGPRPSWRTRLKRRLSWKGWAAGLSAIAAALGVPIAIIAIFNGSGSSPSYSEKGPCNAAGSGNTVTCTINNYRTGLSKDPRAQIVRLTGSWSEQGFVNAIIDRNTRIVALYLKSGMKATTFHENASAILFGFQGEPTQNNDPVALVKTFQAAGFKVDDELDDSYLMGALTHNDFPLMFDTDLAPKGYTGGYQGGTFVGSLLFWIVQRAAWAGPTDQDIQVIKYLISQGADCKVPLSFLKFNNDTLSGTSPYEELLPMMQSCAK